MTRRTVLYVYYIEVNMEDQRQLTINHTKIRLVKGDITEAETDAIVNAANSYLRHGGGVAGVISRKGGPAIQAESDAIGFVPVGECAVTSGGRLKAGFVIHVVGPRLGEGDEDIKLAKAMRNVLRTAVSKGFKSIAVPAISAGIFGFPKAQCAHILMNEMVTFLKENDSGLEEIIFYLVDDEIIGYFNSEMASFDKG